MNPAVSIIIVNYNVSRLLQSCLKSVFLHSRPGTVEVIVVDNASVDDSVEQIRKNFPQVILIENSMNMGFPEANNQGMRIAQGEFIFLLNPDTELKEDTSGIMCDYLRRNDGISLLAPKLLNADGSLQYSVYRFPKLRYLLAEMFYLESLTPGKYYKDSDFNKPFEVDAAAGAALFFRKSLVDKVGMLNPKLFWIEDIDFCYRITRLGGKVLYFPHTSLFHLSGQSAKKNYNVSISNQVINKIKFYKLHGTALQLFLVYLLSIMNTLMRLIVFLLLSPFRRMYFLKMKAYWHTIPLIFTATRGL